MSARILGYRTLRPFYIGGALYNPGVVWPPDFWSAERVRRLVADGSIEIVHSDAPKPSFYDTRVSEPRPFERRPACPRRGS